MFLWSLYIDAMDWKQHTNYDEKEIQYLQNECCFQALSFSKQEPRSIASGVSRLAGHEEPNLGQKLHADHQLYVCGTTL
jgi:hypothetical protein